MKRFGIVSAAALLGLSCLTAVPVQAESQADLVWQAAYQKVLTTYSRMQGFEGSPSREESGSRWDLYDIDGDNTPELFISPDNGHAFGVMIYTCIEGEPKLLQTEETQAFGEYGVCAVNTEHHMIGVFQTGTGIVNRTFYSMEGGTVTKLDSFMNDAETYLEDQRDQTKWMLNGAEVTAAMYFSAYDTYANILWKEDVGRSYAFNDRSPLSSELRSVRAAAPPDMKTALVGGAVAAFAVALIASIVSKLIRKSEP